MAIGIELKEAAEVQAAYELLEQRLYEEYEQKLVDHRNLMVDKVHKYLDYELKKLLESFPENQAAVAAWKAVNPPEEIVDDAMLAVEAEQYIQDLEDQIVGIEAEISELTYQIELYEQKDTLLKTVPNQVEIV